LREKKKRKERWEFHSLSPLPAGQDSWLHFISGVGGDLFLSLIKKVSLVKGKNRFITLQVC